MNKSLEAQLDRLAKKDMDEQIDFDAMWARIEEHLTGPLQTVPAENKIFKLRNKALPIAIAASVFLALPVMAAVSGGWNELWNGKSTATAIEQGFGERLNQTVTNGGIPFTLNGVVTDDQNMNLLFSMKLSDIPAYDAVEFEKADLTDDSGKVENPRIQMKNDTSGSGILGLLTTQNNLKNQQKRYTLSLQNMVFYKYSSIPIDISPETSQNKRAQLATDGYSSIEFVSVMREGNMFTVRYKINSTLTEPASTNPHLILKSGGASFAEKISTVLPSDSSDVIVRQSTFDISDTALKAASFEFSALTESGKREGTWNFAFDADGKKTSQAMFSKKLDQTSVANDSSMAFKELIVTPLEIRLYFDYKSRVPNESEPLINYDNIKLLLGGNELGGSGGVWTLAGGRQYLRFETPEWYKDWSKVPMQLVLSGKNVEERAPKEQLIKLISPAAVKQTASTKLNQFTVGFTYYKDGKDLIVESSSSDPLFRGIVQTYMDYGGKRLFAEMNPTPPGGNGTNKKIERYLNIPDGNLMLNPFLYSWSDPGVTVRIPVN